MSNLAIRRALEVFLAELQPNFPTAWENDDFEESDIAYQQVNLLFAKPDNPTMGDGFYRQRGIFQVTLRFPQNTGSQAAAEHAEMIREAFKRGLSLEADGVTTKIDETPEVSEGRNIEGRYVILVRIRFYADIFERV